LTYPSERVIGYIPSISLRRGSTVYVTTERILVNKGKGQLHLKAHLLTGFLVALVPFVPAEEAVAIVLGIAIIILAVPLNKRRSRRSGKKWPSMKEVEEGVRLFEVRKGQVLSIELRRPGILRSGYLRITSLSGEFSLKFAGKKAFRIVNHLMIQFEPSRVKLLNGREARSAGE
jgi:hypothetical protein